MMTNVMLCTAMCDDFQIEIFGYVSLIVVGSIVVAFLISKVVKLI